MFGFQLYKYDNFNKRYEFRNKQYALDVIMFENIRELSRYILGKVKTLEFKMPDIAISRNDTILNSARS